jgi:hypothetical protein
MVMLAPIVERTRRLSSLAAAHVSIADDPGNRAIMLRLLQSLQAKNFRR